MTILTRRYGENAFILKMCDGCKISDIVELLPND